MSADPDPSAGAGQAPWRRSPAFLLLVGLVALYVVVSFWLSTLRYEMFSTSNWDLGIFQQALWSTLHGHPMYEAGDWESYGTVSLLEVHPGFSLFLVVPFYALAPSAYTLFAVQSVVVGVAAFPLFAIGRHVIGRPWPALVFAGLYLGAAPLLVANLYDFHLEAFLPLEITLLFLCWIKGRYALGLVAAVLALLTLEVAPFLVGAVALYFLWPALHDTGHALRLQATGPRPKGTLGQSLRKVLEPWREVEAHWALLLLSTAVLAYPLLRLIQWFVLPATLPPAPNPAYATALIPGQATDLGLALTWTFTSIPHKFVFWVSLLAAFGFLPLFAPRTLLLQLPWFLFTMQSNLLAFSTIGFQYVFIAIVPFAIGAVFGYPRAERMVLSLARRLRSWARRRTTGSTTSAGVGDVRSRAASRRTRQVLLLGLVVLLMAFNYQIGPLNPHNQVATGPLPGYVVQYDPPPGFSNVVRAAALIPAGATVLASSNLFPLVANDLNAYALLWTPSPPNQLPFGLEHPPTYGFFSTDQLFAVPGWFLTLQHHGQYGLRAVVWVAPTGSVFLYELDYSGPTAAIGPV